jgi:hypothetical protein
MAEAKKFTLVGFEIGGWGSLLALIISVVTLLLTAVDRWVLGPNPAMRFPEMVDFQCDRSKKDKITEVVTCESQSVLKLVANPVTFLNETAAPHAYTVMSSRVIVNFKHKNSVARSLILDWFYFSGTQPIGPVTVVPQETLAKEIQYYARSDFVKRGDAGRLDFLDFVEFQELIGSGEIDKIQLVFEARLSDGDLLTLEGATLLRSTCIVRVDNHFKENARKVGEFPRFARPCLAKRNRGGDNA